ncbi:hypothetical protein [Nonomuraea sp. B1E8]|uniref:hypothetical protein n=1 Tax=unclassified Nonomuraea TaxID=2593643 RepID=UPI00325D6E40
MPERPASPLTFVRGDAVSAVAVQEDVDAGGDHPVGLPPAGGGGVVGRTGADRPGPHQEETLNELLDEIITWSRALRPLRADTPQEALR